MVEDQLKTQQVVGVPGAALRRQTLGAWFQACEELRDELLLANADEDFATDGRRIHLAKVKDLMARLELAWLDGRRQGGVSKR